MGAIRSSVTKNEIISAIPGSKGLICNLEKTLFCTRAAIKAVIEKNPEIDDMLTYESERDAELIISDLSDEAKNGDPKARELFLKARARKYGFGDRLEIAGSKDQPLVFLHAVATDLTGTAPKLKRVENWKDRAVEYHEKQIETSKNKSVDELLTVRKGSGAGK